MSVVVPTFNRADLLTRCLHTVLDQKHRDLEVIVCDHESTDDTFERVTWFALNDARVRYVKVPRLHRYPATAENHWFAGPVDPINAGFRAARGEWIARIDDDDMWCEGHLRDAIRWARITGAEMVTSNVEVQDCSGRRTRIIQPYVAPDGITRLGSVQTWVFRSYLRFMKANIHCWRRPIDRVNDIELQMRMWRAGVRIGHHDKVTAIIRPRPGETKIGLAAYIDGRARYEKEYAFKQT